MTKNDKSDKPSEDNFMTKKRGFGDMLLYSVLSSMIALVVMFLIVNHMLK